MDIAYYKNGWVYHTEFDRPEAINPGSIQRSGENILAVIKAMIRSPNMAKQPNFTEGNKWVFFDVMGLFNIFYEVSQGKVLK